MDAPHRGPAETRVLSPLLFPEPPILQQVFVELLNLPAGELVQLDGPDSRNGVLLDPSFVVPCRRGTDARLGVQLEPQPKPLRHRVLSGAGHIQLLALRDGHGQLALYLRLGPA